MFGRATPPTVPQILSALGQPDGYSDQLYTPGGSLQWLLSSGGELRVDTGDFHQNYWAVRFDRRGRDTALEMIRLTQVMELPAGRVHE